MPARLFERFKDLQAYVGWSEADAARVKSVAPVIDAGMDALIVDFYAEIQRHPDAARVITGGQEQITRLMASLKVWLRESLKGRSDLDYFLRRWNIGLRHAEIGLNPAYTSAAMSRLRNGIVGILSATNYLRPRNSLSSSSRSISYSIWSLRSFKTPIRPSTLSKRKQAEHERSEVKFRMLVEAAACMVVILRERRNDRLLRPVQSRT